MSQVPTRWTLIRGAASGKPDEQAEFARRYDPVIRAYLRARWRQTPLAGELEDAVQQVLLECLREDGALGRAECGRDAGFRGFLFGVVRNVARMIERQQTRSPGRQPLSSLDLEAIASREPDCETELDRAWASALLRGAAGLQRERAAELGPEALRRHELLALRYGEGLPVREIAERWGEPAERLHRELAKAREEYRRALLDVVQELHGCDRAEAERSCSGLFHHFS